jgi:hypothetical protein
MVAAFDAVCEDTVRRYRHGHLKHAMVGALIESEPGAGDDAEHRAIATEDLEDEAFDAGLGRTQGELLEQARADADALQVVRDCECDLCRSAVAQAVVTRKADDGLCFWIAHNAHQCASL